MRLLLNNFEGPLDLLLYLIKIQEINIFNIPIADITKQYLDFISDLSSIDYSQIGEYLAMAANLIEIKAMFCIPALRNQSQEIATNIEEIADNDPRKPLVEKLIEYERIKEATFILEKMSLIGKDCFPSAEYKRRQEEYDNIPCPIKGDKFSLAIAFERSLLKFAENKKLPSVKVRAQKINIHQKMLNLKLRFTTITNCLLTDLYVECLDRYELIITFMSVLELCKAGQVNIEQEFIFSPVKLSQGRNFGEEIMGIDDEETLNKHNNEIKTTTPKKNINVLSV